MRKKANPPRLLCGKALCKKCHEIVLQRVLLRPEVNAEFDFNAGNALIKHEEFIAGCAIQGKVINTIGESLYLLANSIKSFIHGLKLFIHGLKLFVNCFKALVNASKALRY